MTRCIYCTHTLLERNAPGDSRLWRSLEHIIPIAVGGSDDLSTDDACDGCNNDLGASVDSAMLHDFFVVALRQRFRLAGHSGKVPDLEIRGRSRQTGSEVSMKIDPDLGVKWHSRVDVKRERQPNGDETISVMATAEEVLRIITGIKRSAEAKGKRMLEADGRPIGTIEDSIAAASANAQYTTEYEMKTMHDMTAVARGLAKIGFGFAHLALGPDWTFSPNADSLRRAARGICSDDEVMQLVVGRTVGMRDVLLSTEDDRDTRHLIAILPMAENTVVYVSLFGAPLLSLVFSLPVSAMQIGHASVDRRPLMVTMLPTGLDVQWELLPEVTKRLAEHVAML